MSLPPALIAEVTPQLKSRAALDAEVQRLGDIVVRLASRATALHRYLVGAELVTDEARRFRDDLVALLDGNMR